jgi:hypothetical protein
MIKLLQAENDFRIYNIKIKGMNQDTSIDYVSFLFGLIVNDKSKFIEGEFYKSLYISPYDKKKMV